jgi:hypothetical protein
MFFPPSWLVIFVFVAVVIFFQPFPQHLIPLFKLSLPSCAASTLVISPFATRRFPSFESHTILSSSSNTIVAQNKPKSKTEIHKEDFGLLNLLTMGKERIELSFPHRSHILSVVRLPVSPLALGATLLV